MALDIRRAVFYNPDMMNRKPTPANIEIEGRVIHFVRMYDGTLIATVWEPSSPCGNHATITSFESGAFFGQLGSRRIPTEIERLRGGSPERIAACEKWRRAQADEAFALLGKAGVRGTEDRNMVEMEVVE